MECGAINRAERKIEELSMLLPSPVARELFVAFGNSNKIDQTQGRTTSRLEKYARFFAKISPLLRSNRVVDMKELLAVFNVRELRGAVPPISYLTERGFLNWNQQEANDSVEADRLKAILVRHANRSWFGEFEAYRDWLLAEQKNLRTQRIYLGAAAKFFCFAGVPQCSSVGQEALDRFLKANKGQRASMFAFVGWMRSRQNTTLLIAPRPKSDPAKRERQIVRDLRLLLQVLRVEQSVHVRRPLVALAISKASLLPLTKILALRSTDVAVGHAGAILWPDTRRLAVTGILGWALRAILAADSEFVFPGRGGHRAASPDSVRHHWLKFSSRRSGRN